MMAASGPSACGPSNRRGRRPITRKSRQGSTRYTVPHTIWTAPRFNTDSCRMYSRRLCLRSRSSRRWAFVVGTLMARSGSSSCASRPTAGRVIRPAPGLPRSVTTATALRATPRPPARTSLSAGPARCSRHCLDLSRWASTSRGCASRRRASHGRRPKRSPQGHRDSWGIMRGRPIHLPACAR